MNIIFSSDSYFFIPVLIIYCCKKNPDLQGLYKICLLGDRKKTASEKPH